MIEDNIALVLKDIRKIKEDLKDIKKDLKTEEKLDTEEFLEIKKAYDDIKKQKKDLEESWQKELTGMEDYQKLRELKLQKDEDLANAHQKLFSLIAKLPPKPFTMNVEFEEGPTKVQIVPEMHLYLNGKEEKKKILP